MTVITEGTPRVRERRVILRLNNRSAQSRQLKMTTNTEPGATGAGGTGADLTEEVWVFPPRPEMWLFMREDTF